MLKISKRRCLLPGDIVDIVEERKICQGLESRKTVSDPTQQFSWSHEHAVLIQNE